MTYVRNKKIKKIFFVLIGIYVISQYYHLCGGDIRWSHDKRFIAISRAPIIPNRNGFTDIIVIEPFKMKMEYLDSYFLREYRGFAWEKKANNLWVNSTYIGTIVYKYNEEGWEKNYIQLNKENELVCGIAGGEKILVEMEKVPPKVIKFWEEEMSSFYNFN